MRLETIRWLLEHLDNPERCFKSVHIAGTNGKGTVATKIASALTRAKVRCGLYTSPHIATFRERISIDGVSIDREAMTQQLRAIFSFIDSHHIEATFFEVTTALAFAYFRDMGVSYAVVEVGLGGQFDATNVIIPDLAIITSISLDHTHILGNTIEEITREKAGILKQGAPVLLGPNVQKALIVSLSRKLSCPLEQIEGTFDNFEVENLAIATRAIELLGFSSKECEKGLAVLPPCRFEHVGYKIRDTYSDLHDCILDVGHNPDAIKRLNLRLKTTFPNIPLHVVYGASSDKDIKGCLKELLPHVERMTFVQADNSRAENVETLLKIGESLSKSCIYETASSINSGVLQAIQRANERRGVLVICGSFFIMAAARKALGFQEEQESLDLNEKIRQER
jgi:dihydrofolate synthase / folylpolyglutamate synthase